MLKTARSTSSAVIMGVRHDEASRMPGGYPADLPSDGRAVDAG
jgi:hypothetical protein